MLKKQIKTFLRRTGLYAPAVHARDTVRSFRFLPRNMQFWKSGAPDGLPIPPLELIGLVSGQRDIRWFLEGGRLSQQSIADVLKKNGITINSFRSLLDFGCGSGRTIRNFSYLAGKTKLYGVDYNPKLVRWCTDNLPFAQFETNMVAPPMNFQDGSLDFIYALSVFTHMPESLQFAWIQELRRVLSSGGYLLITTHGNRYQNELTEDERKTFAAGKVVVRSEGEVGSNHYGAYHPPEYVTKILCEDFVLVDFIPEGAKGNPYQDLFLLKKEKTQ